MGNTDWNAVVYYIHWVIRYRALWGSIIIIGIIIESVEKPLEVCCQTVVQPPSGRHAVFLTRPYCGVRDSGIGSTVRYIITVPQPGYTSSGV